MNFAVVLAAVPFPARAGRSVGHQLLLAVPGELPNRLLESHEMSMQHQTDRVPLGAAAHSEPYLFHVAQQHMIGDTQRKPARALREISHPCPAVQPGASAVAVGACVPSFLGPEAVSRIRHPRDGLLGVHQTQVVEQQRPLGLQAMVNVQGQHFRSAAHLAITRPTPMSRPSAKRNRDAHPAALRTLDRLLERLPGRIAIAKNEIIALWPLEP